MSSSNLAIEGRTSGKSSATLAGRLSIEHFSGVDNRIRVLREARGLSLEALATEAGTSNQQISLLEAGKRRLTVDWLLRLSTALTCHPWELVEDNLPERLRPQDLRLLDRFRALSFPQQESLLRFLESLPMPAPRRRQRGTASE